MNVNGNGKRAGVGRLNVRAVSESTENTVGRTLNDAGAAVKLTPLEWRLTADGATYFEGQYPGGRSDPSAVTACSDWAIALGLSEDDFSSSDSYRLWSGEVGAWGVSLFAVSDEALYRAEFPDHFPRPEAQ
ncbi:hypothetical protein ACVXZ4_13180 [Lacisediminihabitans sp. FW035]